jgi:hypothetical protein
MENEPEVKQPEITEDVIEVIKEIIEEKDKTKVGITRRIKAKSKNSKNIAERSKKLNRLKKRHKMTAKEKKSR